MELLSFETTGALGSESKVICCPSKVYDVFLYPVPTPPVPKSSFFLHNVHAQAAAPASSLGCVLLTSNAIIKQGTTAYELHKQSNLKQKGSRHLSSSCLHKVPIISN